MSVTVSADLAVKEPEIEWVKGFLLQAVANGVGKIEGFEAGELLQNQDDPNNLIIWQQFASRTDYENYMNSASSVYPAEDLGRYFAAFKHPAAIRFFDTVEA